jgi:hypothetical protein
MRTIELKLSQYSERIRPNFYVEFHIEPKPGEYRHIYVNDTKLIGYKGNGLIFLAIQHYPPEKPREILHLAVLLMDSPFTNLRMQKKKKNTTRKINSAHNQNHNGE